MPFNNYVNRCSVFWNRNWQTFSNPQMPVTNPLPLNLNKNPYPGFEVAVFNDPGCGGTYGQNVYVKKNGLLIVGCNPSGIAKHHIYRKAIPNPQSPDYRNFYIVNTYPLVNDPYTKAIHDFANACGYGENYYKMDVFGIMRLKQSVLSDDIEDKYQPHLKEYQELFEIFVDTVIDLQPEKIVFVNAFISNLINGIRPNYTNIVNNHVIVGTGINNRTNKGGLSITFNNNGRTFKSTAWFSSMLSGQRALDNGSKGLLTWAVHK